MPKPLSTSFLREPRTETDSSYQSRIGLTIDEIYIISSQLQSNQSNADSHTAQQLNDHSSLLTDILSSQSALHSLIQNQSKVNERIQLPTQDAPMSIDHQSLNQVIYTRAFFQQRSPCPPYCRCGCHRIRTFQSPTMMNHVIGNLLVGYCGYPIIGTFQKCTETGCLSQSTFRTYVYYIFPSWFLAKAIILGLTTQSFGEISISLKMQRVIPAGSDIFRLATLDNVDGIKELFRKGLASPNDITLIGTSALNVRFSYLSMLRYVISVLGRDLSH